VVLAPFSAGTPWRQRAPLCASWRVLALRGIVVLGETLEPYHLAGATLIFAGIWLTTAAPSRTAR
jgi:drug/metabolite transporter (DMT)-like permease